MSHGCPSAMADASGHWPREPADLWSNARALSPVSSPEAPNRSMKQSPLNLASLGVRAGVLATPLLGVQAGEPGAQLMQIVLVTALQGSSGGQRDPPGEEAESREGGSARQRWAARGGRRRGRVTRGRLQNS